MSELRVITDPEEIGYARKIASMGKVLPHEGKHYFTVSYLKLVSNLTGAIRVGCVVETEKERDIKQGIDQDFGNLKIMFYALFDEKQAENLMESHPGISLVQMENRGKAIFLTWHEYKHLVHI